MGAPKALLRVYSYIFELLVIVSGGAIGCFALYNHTPLNLPFLPWSAPQLASGLFYSTLVGLFTLVLAVAGKLRALFFLCFCKAHATEFEFSFWLDAARC